ncbi:hypothetical protein EXIGLDRAFT_733634 [Exidia glandulosa HHB12029]|uniref:Uncharacterized protein n=1 Tax=Exidia glandulosa HHB12029 TaxID=1314781 RepID=A0A165KG31_EXIGL|nr:hypothetical protein EXIGLDRAFT_733634 [Exidia glandulosa HHB12029]
MYLSALASALVLLPFASAFISSVAPGFTGSYKADQTTSTFPVLFNTGSTMVDFMDLTVSFGLSTPADHTSNDTLGSPLFNMDLLAMRRSSTGPGKFTIDVPIKSSDLFNGAGTYILTAAVLHVSGVNQNGLVLGLNAFPITFNATVS